MTTLCIIPCGSKKIWDKNPNTGATAARDVYIGGFSKKCREYAEKFYPLSWCILSAKYGFVLPNEVISEPYNVSFNDKSTNPISVPELITQSIEKGLNNCDNVVVLGGKNYVRFAQQVFSSKQIITPLSDCKGIGYMMGRLSELIKHSA
jgi:hypothetical protein